VGRGAQGHIGCAQAGGGDGCDVGQGKDLEMASEEGP
jgi:hypothetical protein